MSPQTHLLVAWITVTVLSLLAVIAVFVWAVRTHQFSHQDRARYLALDEGIPPEDESEKTGDAKKEVTPESLVVTSRDREGAGGLAPPKTEGLQKKTFSNGKPAGEDDRVST